MGRIGSCRPGWHSLGAAAPKLRVWFRCVAMRRSAARSSASTPCARWWRRRWVGRGVPHACDTELAAAHHACMQRQVGSWSKAGTLGVPFQCVVPQGSSVPAASLRCSAAHLHPPQGTLEGLHDAPQGRPPPHTHTHAHAHAHAHAHTSCTTHHAASATGSGPSRAKRHPAPADRPLIAR